jgi:hypothetical protein
VTQPERRVALVSIADANRTLLAAYLTSAGFEVHELDDLAVPSSFGALVVLGDETFGGDILARVRSWMKLTKLRRVVVVTSKPAALRDLVVTHPERLFVLPAPVFGWELVDALRSPPVPRPRGA